MWTFDNLPLKILKEKYGFEPSRAWVDRVRTASIRFNNGGSGSFVSPEGLVLTNHHGARGQLQKISTPEKDYVRDGFLARTREEELASPDLEVNVLVSTEDVTARVMAVITPGMPDKDALDARKAVMGQIEKESLDATGLRSDVVSLYHGGEYWLYRYRKYTVRPAGLRPRAVDGLLRRRPRQLHLPPPRPRHLPHARLRGRQAGQPGLVPALDSEGRERRDLVFVSGHPGSTSRLETTARLRPPSGSTAGFLYWSARARLGLWA